MSKTSLKLMQHQSYAVITLPAVAAFHFQNNWGFGTLSLTLVNGGQIGSRADDES
jgi:hypothetical protein